VKDASGISEALLSKLSGGRADAICSTKGDKNGVKKDRPNLRIVRKSQFCKIANIPALYKVLFGTDVVDFASVTLRQQAS